MGTKLTILRHQGPREFKVGIPALEEGKDDVLLDWRHSGSRTKDSEMMKALMRFDLSKLVYLKNKLPVWNVKRRKWTLDFHGRVKQSSVKNFQLITPKDPNRVILQHGKVGFDDFTMDVQWPMSPLVAFAICLTSLHGKLTVE